MATEHKTENILKKGSVFEGRPLYYCVFAGRGGRSDRYSLSIYNKKLGGYANYNMEMSDIPAFIQHLQDIVTEFSK